MPKKKLIEVALPLDAINAQSAREKSIRQGHPSTLHLWWSRKPTATARAVLFAQLVDDPSSYEDQYRAEAEEVGHADVDALVAAKILAERERLFGLIARMVDWDNLGDEGLFDEIRTEIIRSTNHSPPTIIDPFAGGGTIPLEAQRLGLPVHASDLNPVSVLITKALVELPAKFAGQSPVFPDAAGQKNEWPKASGLAEDVRRYGDWMRREAERRIGHMYPAVTLDDGSSATVIAWVWARTVICPNPACGIEMPLVSKWSLGRKKGKEAYIEANVVGNHVEYAIGHDPTRARTEALRGTVTRAGAICIRCSAAVDFEHIRAEGRAGRLGASLMATVAEGNRRRVYLPPDQVHLEASQVDLPKDLPPGRIADQALGFRVQAYGMTEYHDLFTNRQLVALTTLSELISEVREMVVADARAASADDHTSDDNADIAYADAVATYLGLVVSRLSDYLGSLATWASNPQMEIIAHVFTRQALAMSWDFAEGNPLADSSGSLSIMVRAVTRVLDQWTYGKVPVVRQAGAEDEVGVGRLISTDPPYFDNIGYADLSDYFYVWLRRSLQDVYPRLLSTILVPKAEELVANPYRHGGSEGAKEYFEEGFSRVFSRAREHALEDFPITVYYAFKQTESHGAGSSSTGWETILTAMIRGGWTITATWPMRSERAGRMTSIGTNALASSIVLALRPRLPEAPVIDRRGFVTELRSALPGALRDLQLGNVAPVDLAQAAIGPGMAIYSKYAEVVEPNGAGMPVRAALQQVNAILAEVLSAQEGDFDSDTRWCIAWFESRGFEEGPYGEAEVLASAKGSSVDGIRRSGVLTSRGGKVALLAPHALPLGYDPRNDDRVSLWEIVMHLAFEMSAEGGGVEGAGQLLARAGERGLDVDAAHELAYLLFAVCERKGWAAAGVLFNSIGGSWPEIRAAAHAAPLRSGTLDRQLALELAEEA